MNDLQLYFTVDFINAVIIEKTATHLGCKCIISGYQQDELKLILTCFFNDYMTLYNFSASLKRRMNEHGVSPA
jgi:hypothetical protein